MRKGAELQGVVKGAANGANARGIFDHFYSNKRGSRSNDAEGLSGGVGEIDDALFGKRTAVIDDHFRGAAVFHEYNLGTVELFLPDGQPLVVAFNQQVPTGVTLKPESEFLNRALRGLEVTRTEAFGDGDVIRGGVPVYARDKRIVGVVVVDYYVPKSISKRAIQISQSYEQYKFLTFLKAPVKNSYLLTMGR